MYTKILLCCLVAYAAAQQDSLEGPPQPYSFSYDNTDEFGTHLSQQETGDENNNKVGSYSYTDPNGVTRTVKYTADADGFHVVVETNEPGTKTSNPADAQYIANPIEVAPAPAAAVVAKPVAAVKPVVLQAATPVVHAAPFTVQAAPISYATAHHVTPITVATQPIALAHAPLTYTLGRAKSA
uniref:Putative cuticle protein n=1 Tax=Amblyomma triste TaxID=251400 RepID=A0A023GML2_AMBTT